MRLNGILGDFRIYQETEPFRRTVEISANDEEDLHAIYFMYAVYEMAMGLLQQWMQAIFYAGPNMCSGRVKLGKGFK